MCLLLFRALNVPQSRTCPHCRCAACRSTVTDCCFWLEAAGVKLEIKSTRLRAKLIEFLLLGERPIRVTFLSLTHWLLPCPDLISHAQLAPN